MATLKLTSTLTSTDLTSDSISSVVAKSATVTQGGITRDNITAVVGAPLTLIPHANHAAGSYVYFKNAGTLNLSIKIGAGAATIFEIYLIPGTWAMFPWTADTNDISVYASGATGCLLEYGVFE